MGYGGNGITFSQIASELVLAAIAGRRRHATPTFYRLPHEAIARHSAFTYCNAAQLHP